MQHNRGNITQRVKKIFFKIYVYLNIKLSHSMNGSDVWDSSAPYGDVLPVFKWNIYKRMNIFHSKLS